MTAPSVHFQSSDLKGNDVMGKIRNTAVLLTCCAALTVLWPAAAMPGGAVTGSTVAVTRQTFITDGGGFAVLGHGLDHTPTAVTATGYSPTCCTPDIPASILTYNYGPQIMSVRVFRPNGTGCALCTVTVGFHAA